MAAVLKAARSWKLARKHKKPPTDPKLLVLYQAVDALEAAERKEEEREQTSARRLRRKIERPEYMKVIDGGKSKQGGAAMK